MLFWIFSEYLGYFLVGIILDVLLTINWRLIAQEKAVFAAIFSVLVTISSTAVFYSITQALDPSQGFTRIAMYALGVGVGTYLGVRFPLSKK